MKRETLQPKHWQSAAAPYHEKGGRVWYRSFCRICPPLCVPSAAWFLCPRTPPPRSALLAVPRAPGSASAMHCPILMIYVPPCDIVLLCTWGIFLQFIWSISSSLSGSLSGAFPPVNWSISSMRYWSISAVICERQVITRPSRRHRRGKQTRAGGAHNSTQTARTLLSRHARGATSHAFSVPKSKCVHAPKCGATRTLPRCLSSLHASRYLPHTNLHATPARSSNTTVQPTIMCSPRILVFFRARNLAPFLLRPQT